MCAEDRGRGGLQEVVVWLTVSYTGGKSEGVKESRKGEPRNGNQAQFTELHQNFYITLCLGPVPHFAWRLFDFVTKGRVHMHSEALKKD